MEIKVIKDALQYIEKRINGATDKIVKAIGTIKLEQADIKVEKTVIDLSPVIKELQAIKKKEPIQVEKVTVNTPDHEELLKAILSAIQNNKPEQLREELDAFGKSILTLKPKDEVTINPVQMKGLMSALTGGRSGIATTPYEEPVTLAIQLDDTTTTNVIYVGKAKIGALSAEAIWQVQKIDETSGLVITWADGNALFDNSWDNRASLTYL